MSAIIIKGEDIRRARKARGMTLNELASIVGRDHSIVSKWERGLSEVGPESAKRLAAWLGQPVELTTNKSNSPTTPIPIPPPLADLASELGVDLAQLYATIGTEAVRAEVKRLWKEAHAEAIEQHNAYIEQHGIPLSDVRAW